LDIVTFTAALRISIDNNSCAILELLTTAVLAGRKLYLTAAFDASHAQLARSENLELEPLKKIKAIIIIIYAYNDRQQQQQQQQQRTQPYYAL